MTRFVRSDGVRVAYDAIGGGSPALVFIPGWCCDRTFFAPQVEHFARRHRVVAVDLRGLGDSDRPDPSEAAYTVAAMASDVAAVLAAENISGAVLVGHSLGAIVALAGAASPGTASAVVLVDPSPVVDRREKFRFRRYAAAVATDIDGSWRRRLVEGFFLPSDSRRRADIVSTMSSAPPAIAAATIEAVAEYDAAATLAAVAAPVLYLGSAWPSDTAAGLRSVSRLVTVGQVVGAGHFLQLEVPGQVNALIERFLARLGLSGTGAAVTVSPARSSDAEWVVAHLEAAWGSTVVARRGETVEVTSCPGFIARIGGDPVGFAAVDVRGEDCEVVVVSAAVEGAGVGRALMSYCIEDARRRGCRRLWLVTTNDNLRAIGFYQRLGMTLCAFRRSAVTEARRSLKPEIALHNADGLLIEHELEFELLL